MIETFKKDEEFINSSVKEITTQILKKTNVGKIFRIGLSGGRTPFPIYKKLAEQNIPWGQVEVYIVDERYVPLNHQHSNYGMIRETFVDKIFTQPRKLVFFDTSLPIEESLKKYESQLDTSQKEFFDLIILGIGSDGHIASLFPNSGALLEQVRWVAHTTTEQFDIYDRLTLTYPALESSHGHLFLIKGKQELLNELLHSAEKNQPASTFLHKKNTIIFVSSLNYSK